MKSIYHEIYNRIFSLIPNLESIDSYVRLTASSFMDLHVDILAVEAQAMRISMAHNFRQNGDVVPDPDMEIRIWRTCGMAEALTFQNQFIYQEVYRSEDKVDLVLKEQLNAFLLQWLKNLAAQGHQVRGAA